MLPYDSTRALQVESEVARLLSRQQVLVARRESLLQSLQREQLAPRVDWATGIFEWDARVEQLLGQVFKLGAFRWV